MILRVRGLCKSFGGLSAVTDCGFDLEENKITGLIGPNGAGKTTVFNLITGFLKPDKGEIVFRGKSLVGLEPFKITNLGISRTFQDLRIFRKLTVMENVVLGTRGMFGEGLFQIFFRHRKARQQMQLYAARAGEILEFAGIADKANAVAEDLSFAEWKLLSLARALAADPDVILFDEPASGLDLKSLDGILDLLTRLTRQNKTILIIEHNLDVIRGIADSVCFLSPGGVMNKQGTCEEILRDRDVINGYLGVSRG